MNNLLFKSTGRTTSILIILVVILGYSYFLLKEKKELEILPGSYIFSSVSSNKKIHLVSTLTGDGLGNDITLTTEGFDKNDPITLLKGKLKSFHFTDLNNDTFEELVLIFAPYGESTSEEIVAYTTYDNSSLSEVIMNPIREEDLSPGGIFEKYAGQDTYILEQQEIYRTFRIEKDEPLISEGLELPEDEVTEERLEETSPSEVITSSTSEESTEGDTEELKKRIVYTMTSYEDMFYLEPKELTERKVYTASSSALLSNTVWNWVSINHEGNITTPNENSAIEINFLDDMTFVATTSCEVLLGNYAGSNYVIRLGGIEVIEQLATSCDNSNALFKEMVSLAESYVIRDKQLMITLAEDNGVILFSKK